MRRRTISSIRRLAVAIAVSFAVAGSAGAYEFRLVGPDLWSVSPGEIVEYDLFFDIPVNDGLVLFSLSVTYDPTVLTYRQDLSSSNDYYPLYTGAVGKQPVAFLEPYVGYGPDVYAPDGPGFDTWPAPPPGLAQVNVDFLNPVLGAPTYGTAMNLWLGSIAFEVVGPGLSLLDLSFDNGGNIFNVNGSDWSNQVTLLVIVPEPATALLVGLGLVVVGVTARGRV